MMVSGRDVNCDAARPPTRPGPEIASRLRETDQHVAGTAAPPEAGASGETPEEGGAPYLFGDLLALARADWVRRMAAAVADSGYPDYRPTDAAIMRLLVRRGGAAISRIGEPLGVSRQAARKLVDGLEQRGYAYEARDEHDARSVKVALTPAGQAYAGAVIGAVHALNREVAERVGADDLVVADAVLRATITAEGLRTVAAHIASPTPGPGGRRGCETS